MTLQLFAARNEKYVDYQLINADSIAIMKKEILYLYDNVHFIYDDNTFFADRAIIHEADETVKLFGNVKIENDSILIYSDDAFYSKMNRIISFNGNIKAYSDSLYFESVHGNYNINSDFISLKDKVFLKETHADSTIRTYNGDILNFDRKNGKLFSSGNIKAYDEKENIYMSGGELDYDLEKKYGFLKIKPHIYVPGKDSMSITARKLECMNDFKKIVATFDVKTSSADYSINSDFLIYMTDTEEAVFLGDPEFLSDFADGKADEFHIFFEERDLKSARFTSNCEVKFAEKENAPKSNWITSDKMEFFFDEDNNIQSYIAENNVVSYFKQMKTADKEYTENSAKGDYIKVFLNDDNEMESIIYKGNVKGTYSFEDKNN